MTEGAVRIGELSRRSGVSPELLRAWERRYGLLRPTRSPGGLRLYSSRDLTRVQAMQQHLAQGLAAAEAAALVVRDDSAETPSTTVRDELAGALSSFDDPAAHAAFDSMLAQLSVDTLLRDILIPYLHDLGQQWEDGEASIAQEHFASTFLRGRLLGLARGWGKGIGPAVVLACAPGEQHDLGLLAFGLALHERGWRIVYLGSDTPIESVAHAAQSCDAAFVVISAVKAATFKRHRAEFAELADVARVCFGGAGARDADPRIDALRLIGDPVEEAERLTRLNQR